MTTRHEIDQFEGTVRFALGVVLLLMSWDYGWTVIGAGAVALAIISFGTAFTGLSLIDRVIAGDKMVSRPLLRQFEVTLRCSIADSRSSRQKALVQRL
jgi:hypothetical protein